MNGEEIRHLSDREILLLIAERSKVLPDHERRIRRLEYVAWSAWPAIVAIMAWLKAHIMGGK
jgi:hypothetical protein